MSNVLYYTVGNDLTHHGIKGQKWGQRNGPPYPLGASDHSSAEKKAGTKGWSKEAKNDAKQSSTKVSKTPTANKKVDEYRFEMINRYSKSDPSKAKKYKNASNEELAEEYQRRKNIEKTVLIAAGVVGISAACYLAYKSGAIERLSKLQYPVANDAAKAALHESMDDLDYVISKDSVLHRMSAYKDFDPAKTKDKVTYVTVTEKDRLGYMAFLSDWHGTGKRYDVSLQATKDIIAPSDKKAKEIFQELWDSDPSYKEELTDTIVKASCKIKYGDTNVDPLIKEVIEKKVRKSIEQDPFKLGIYSFVKGQGDSKKLAAAYKARGYSAIVDYFDKDAVGQQPMILFDASSDVVKTGEQFVTKRMKTKAIKMLSTATDHPLQMRAKSQLGMLQRLMII